MIPLRDRNPTYTTPVVNIFLIVVNVIVFLYQLSLGPAAEQRFVFQFALIPAALPAAFSGNANITLADAFVPYLTSMFLHGGFLHLAGNMLFLWVFGDNIEDRLGHVRYLIFYVICGLAAGFAHTLTNAGSVIPTVGASGAISGVLGAYLILFPGARVLTLIPILVFFYTIELPAFVLLGLWFVIQFFSGIADTGAGGGVAWWAHIGGFLFGMLMIKIFAPPVRRRGIQVF